MSQSTSLPLFSPEWLPSPKIFSTCASLSAKCLGQLTSPQYCDGTTDKNGANAVILQIFSAAGLDSFEFCFWGESGSTSREKQAQHPDPIEKFATSRKCRKGFYSIWIWCQKDPWTIRKVNQVMATLPSPSMLQFEPICGCSLQCCNSTLATPPDSVCDGAAADVVPLECGFVRPPKHCNKYYEQWLTDKMAYIWYWSLFHSF